LQFFEIPTSPLTFPLFYLNDRYLYPISVASLSFTGGRFWRPGVSPHKQNQTFPLFCLPILMLLSIALLFLTVNIALKPALNGENPV
jgi:hypothetical protein